MYRQRITNSLKALLLLCLSLAIFGCGGGGGGGTSSSGDSTTTITGIAMKGPIKGAKVEVFQLLVNGKPGDLLGSGLSGNDGRYAIGIPTSRANGPLLIKVTAQAGAKYVSETLGTDVAFTSPGESFSAVVDSFSPGQQVTVSPVTDIAYQKLQQNLTVFPSLATTDKIEGAVTAANTYIGTQFNIGDILAAPTATANTSYPATLTVIDQMVQTSKTSGATDTVAVKTLLTSAFQSASPATNPAYQTYLQELTAAVNTVKIANPAFSTAVQGILTQATNPPPEPIWTDSTPPTAPSNLSASTAALTATTSSVLLAWGPSTDNTPPVPAAGYEVFRNGIKIANVTTTTYIDPSVTSNVTYTYHILAFDAAGNRSAASNSVSVTPLGANLGVTFNGQLSSSILGLPPQDVTAPTAPSNLSASASAISATASSVTLFWTAATDDTAVTSYEIYRNSVLINTVLVPGYTDPSVTSDVTYIYSIKALDARGNRSAASNLLSVTPPKAALNVTFNGQLSP